MTINDITSEGKISIFGELFSVSGEHYLGDASQIVDRINNGKRQYEINSEVLSAISDINTTISNLSSFKFEVYASLDAITTPSGNVLYLIGPVSGQIPDKYEEYVYSVDNSEFLKIGDTSLDLSNYATKTYVDDAIDDIEEAVGDLHTVEDNASLDALIVTIDGKQYAVAREEISKPSAPVLNKADNTIFEGSGSCKVTGSDGVTLKYTITYDGTTPQDPSATIGTPINSSSSINLPQDTSMEQKTYKIKVAAFKYGEMSDIISRTFYVKRKVAAVTITFDGNDYDLTRTITMSCETPGVVITYTTDGSTPTSESTAYDPNNKPVLSEGIYTIKAYAYVDSTWIPTTAQASGEVYKAYIRYGVGLSSMTVSTIEQLTRSNNSTAIGVYALTSPTTTTNKWIWFCFPTRMSDVANLSFKDENLGFGMSMADMGVIGDRYRCYRSLSDLGVDAGEQPTIRVLK